MRHSSPLLFSLLALGFTAPARGVPPTYVLTDLGTLGGTSSAARALNERGDVVGESTLLSGDVHAFLWREGRMVDLGTLGGARSEARGINDAGEIVGWSLAANSSEHRAFLYAGASMRDLGTLGGRQSEARAINQAGLIVGWAETAGGNRHAFLYSGNLIDLGTLGGTRSAASAINNRGIVVGTALGSDNDPHAFVYSGGAMVALDIGALVTNCIPTGVNLSGEIVGGYWSGYPQAFRIAGGPLIPLIWSPPSAVLGGANGLNEAGQIVGSYYNHVDSSDPTAPGSGAFLFHEGKVHDLQRLLLGAGSWRLWTANAINNRGWIVGEATRGDGQSHAVLLTPTRLPLPADILTAVAAREVAIGGRVFLNASALNDGIAYQWKRDGIALPGATNSSYDVASATGEDMGIYTLVVSSEGRSVESPPIVVLVATGGTSRLRNFSTLGLASRSEPLVLGFVVRGAGRQPVLLRASGPALAPFGIRNSVADPRIDLVRAGTAVPLLGNDDWNTAADVSALLRATTAAGAFALAPGSKDAATIATLEATADGVGYSLHASTADSATGALLTEIYDVAPFDSGSRITNVSARGFVGTEADVLLSGFVIEGTAPKQLLIRAVGATLESFGAQNALRDPIVAVHPAGSSFAVARNDDWEFSASLAALSAQAGAFPLMNRTDSAIAVRLPPGAYTVVTSGWNHLTGAALLEIYDLDP